VSLIITVSAGNAVGAGRRGRRQAAGGRRQAAGRTRSRDRSTPGAIRVPE
jgi:hypothetical protein